jgi:N-acetylmuramoyl-L-alanine amidase
MIKIMKGPLQFCRRNLVLPLLTISLGGLASNNDANADAAKLVVLDAGHGGHDRGASHGGIFESEIALKITRLVGEKLQASGHKVLYTRTKDEWISLEKRANIANQARGDLFVSIHLNSSSDSRARGKEFYFQNQVPVDEEALFLANRENQPEFEHDHETSPAKRENASDATLSEADRIQLAGLRQAESARIPNISNENPRIRRDLKNILEDLDRSARVRASSELAVALFEEWKSKDPAPQSSGRSIRQAPFFLVSHVAMPSVLIEVGFLSHKRESEKLNTESYQESLANSIAEGIRKNIAEKAAVLPPSP